MSGEGVRPICQLIEAHKSFHVGIQIQVIEHTPGQAEMKIYFSLIKNASAVLLSLVSVCVLVVGDKCKHLRKSSVEQICSDSSIKAAAADYASFFRAFITQ